MNRSYNDLLKDTGLEIENWTIEEDSNVMRKEMSNIIRRVAKDICGIKKVSVASQAKLVVWGGPKQLWGNEHILKT